MMPTIFYCIFGPNQIEHPGQFVVRRFLCEEGNQPVPEKTPVALAVSLAAARETIPGGMERFERVRLDDPSLIEYYVAAASAGEIQGSSRGCS